MGIRREPPQTITASRSMTSKTGNAYTSSSAGGFLHMENDFHVEQEIKQGLLRICLTVKLLLLFLLETAATTCF